jgi:exodeoxyribonuclease VII small subunit
MAEKDPQQPDFEAALNELEGLVKKLETGDLPLNESLDEFRRGIELTRHCQDVLDKAQLSVEQLMNLDDEASGKPFEPDA